MAKTSMVVVAHLPRDREGREAIKRLLQADDLTFKNGLVIVDDVDNWWRDTATYVFSVEDFLDRFCSTPYERGFNAALEQTMLTETFKAVKEKFLGAPERTITPAQAKDRAEVQAIAKNEKKLRAELAAIELEGDVIRAKIHSGELTREALSRHGERVRPIELQLERLNGSGDILVNTCTDVELCGERAALVKMKRTLCARVGEAQRRLDQAKENTIGDRQAVDRIKASIARGILMPEDEVAQAERRLFSSESDVVEAQADYETAMADIRDLQIRLDRNRKEMMEA